MHIMTDYLKKCHGLFNISAIFQTSGATSPPGGLGASMLAHPSLSSLILGPSWLILGLSWLVLGLSWLILAASLTQLGTKMPTIFKISEHTIAFHTLGRPLGCKS